MPPRSLGGAPGLGSRSSIPKEVHDDQAVRHSPLARDAPALDARGARASVRAGEGELRRRHPEAGVPAPQPERPHPRAAGRRPRPLGVPGDQSLPGAEVRQGPLAEAGRGRGACLPVEPVVDDRARGAGAHRAPPSLGLPRGSARPEEGRRRGRALQAAARRPRWRARRQGLPPRQRLHGRRPERRRGALLGAARGPRSLGRAERPGLARPLHRAAGVRARPRARLSRRQSGGVARRTPPSGSQRKHFRPWQGRVVVVVLVVEAVVVVVALVVVVGDDTVVVVTDEVVVVGGDVVLVVAVVLVVVVGPGTLAGSAGSEPASSSVRSKNPSSSRSMPIRVPLPGGTAVYVSSWPAVPACARRLASPRSGSLARSLWNWPEAGW